MDHGRHVPIGCRLAGWRTRRGVTTAELASTSGLSEQVIVEVESGGDWVDRQRVLYSLAAGLRLDPVDLTGQPYPPVGAEHAVVRSAAWHLRQYLTEPGAGARRAAPGGLLAELRTGTAAVRRAEAGGDEHVLAVVLPALLELADRSVVGTRGVREEVRTARTSGYVAAVGLLRRVGYRDLAWSLLQQARMADPGGDRVLAEEVRLLTSMGLADTAAVRSEQQRDTPRTVELLCAAGLAHAAAGQRRPAQDCLAEASACVSNEAEAAELLVAQAGCAMEFGDLEEILVLQDATGGMPAGRRADLLLLGAAAWARNARADRAVERLAAAEAVAPLYVRLSPLARELLHALKGRARDTASTRVLARTARRFGVR